MICRLSLSLFVGDDLEDEKRERGKRRRGICGDFILIAIIDSDIRNIILF